ncbi:MAG TPA: DUF4038 domain-containing protein [Ilumatobacteraceae bacterium]|nr:DUF4038 domain-containing protein [Ilumatobacteraceae bacterium]
MGHGAAAAPTFVQQANAVPQTPQTTVTAKYVKAQTAGNTNIVAVGWNNATSNITSLTDSGGNTYALGAPVTRGSGLSQAIYYAKNIVAAPANSNTVRVVFNSSTAYVDLRITEYAGLDRANPFDKTASATGSSSSSATAALTTTSNNELVFGAGMTTGTFSGAGSGFTTRVITSPDADIVFDKSVSATGSYNVSARQTGSWVLQMATFRSTAAAADTTAPTAPTNLTATAVSPTQINLAWTASADDAGVVGYQIYRDGTQVATTSATSYQSTGLSAGTTYSYQVAAYDAAGNVSARSNSAGATTTASPDTTAPAVPTGLTATAASTSQINLSWSASTDNVGVTGYKVFRGGTQIATSTTTSFQDTGLTSGTAYSYTIAASDAAGNNSAQSTSATGSTNGVPDTSAPTVPTGLQATAASSTTIQLTWTASTDNSGVTGYKIYRGGVQVSTVTNTGYSNTGLTPATAYSYAVSAYDAAGNTSPMSGSVSATTATTTTTTSLFPLSLSSNHRYLVDRTGAPFPIMGRTAWFITSLTSADYHTFIDDTVAKGYNSIEFHVINHDGRGKNPPYNGIGDLPFLKNLNGGTYTGILADQGGYSSGLAPDFTTPNPTFWSYVDGLLDYAASKNMAVFMFPAYVGAGGGNSQGWMTEMTANGQAKMQTYGAFLADRFKNRGNIVWMMGGDYGHFNTSQLATENGLLAGLKSVSGQSTFFSAEWDSAVNGTDQPDLGSQMTLNSVYDWGGNIYDQGRKGYSHSPTEPAFLLEEPYDQEGPDGNGVNPYATQPTRRFQWWGWLESVGGYISGNGYLWPFQSGWQSHLNTQTAQDMARLNSFMQSYHWYDLVPSGLGGMKNLVAAGGGAGGGNNATAVAASATPDGNLLIAYVPPAHSGSVTIDMTALSGSVTARWYDPTNGTYSTVSGSPLTNTGTKAFTPPGNNSAGQTDWVLVLTSNISPLP